MSVYKNTDTGTWYAMCWFTDWKGEAQAEVQAGLYHQERRSGMGAGVLMQKQADVTMTFASFAELYEKNVKPKLKLNIWLAEEKYTGPLWKHMAIATAAVLATIGIF